LSSSAALVLIDYQPSQFATVRSMDEALLRKNIVSTVGRLQLPEAPDRDRVARVGIVGAEDDVVEPRDRALTLSPRCRGARG
jgi:hypothetical protein